MRDPNGNTEFNEDMKALDAEVQAVERLPAAWLDAAEGKVSVDELLADVEATDAQRRAVRELFHPLDPRARDRLAAAAAEKHLGLSEGEGKVIPMPSRWRRWLWAAPAVAAAAVLVMFLRAPGDEMAPFAGDVSLQSAHRYAPAAPGNTLDVPVGEYFYLDCRAQDRKVEVFSVRATGRGGNERVQYLGFSASEVSPRGALLHVLADLPPGRWDVTCGGAEAGTGRFAWFARSVELAVR